MMYRQLNIAPRNRAAAVALVVVAMVVGGAVLALGLGLLLGLLALAVVGSAGVAVYRRVALALRGGRSESGDAGRRRALDPSMEVFRSPADARTLRQPKSD